MRKNAKKTSSKQARKADVKDLAVKNSATVKGGKVSMHDFTVVKSTDQASTNLMTALR